MSLEPPQGLVLCPDAPNGAAIARGPAARGRFQFTLAMLFSLTAAVSLFMGVWAWRGPHGALRLCLAAAVGVVVVGVVRWRLRLIVAGLALFGAILLALSLAYKYTSPMAGTAVANVSLRVRVLDASTGSPVRLAEVRLLGGDSPADPARTGADGTAEFSLPMTCTVEGVNWLVSVTSERTVNPWMTLEAKARGYETATRWLPDDLGRRCVLQGDRLPDVEVLLAREPKKEPARPRDEQGSR